MCTVRIRSNKFYLFYTRTGCFLLVLVLVLVLVWVLVLVLVLVLGGVIKLLAQSSDRVTPWMIKCRSSRTRTRTTTTWPLNLTSSMLNKDTLQKIQTPNSHAHATFKYYNSQIQNWHLIYYDSFTTLTTAEAATQLHGHFLLSYTQHSTLNIDINTQQLFKEIGIHGPHHHHFRCHS